MSDAQKKKKMTGKIKVILSRLKSENTSNTDEWIE